MAIGATTGWITAGMNVGAYFGVGGRTVLKYGMVSDGLSNTAAISECKLGRTDDRRVTIGFCRGAPVNTSSGSPPSLCLAMVGPGNLYTGNVGSGAGDYREIGWSWTDGLHIYTGYFHMLPPNGPSCGIAAESWALITPSSFHPGGVNVTMHGHVDSPWVKTAGGNKTNSPRRFRSLARSGGGVWECPV